MQRLQYQKNEGSLDANLSRRDRPRPRPFYPGIEIAIGNVIERAAGTAHDNRADEKQKCIPEIGSRRPAEARQEQDPTSRE